MKETDFIEQNKDKWEEFEKELARDDARPDRISHLYIDTVDDLSFARTHYPNRLVRSYLNGVTEVLSLKIQKSQRTYWKNIKLFWQRDLPLAMFEARNQFLIAFLILICSVGIGIFSSMHDASFAEYILGESYVQTTIENIEKGDPLAIYKDRGQADMFFSITLNNILVSVRTFLLSLFFGFGTVLILIYNGVMLGVFQYFFIERGLFFESFLTIWQHGVVEISCIVLAGAAGLVLAKGILFPETYSRLDALRIAGRKSLIILMGLMPLLVYSGFIEAFVTRYTEVHWVIRLSTILLSVGFILSYFVWYPRRVSKTTQNNQLFTVVTQPIVTSNFSLKAIQPNVTIFWESIRVLSVLRPWIFGIAVFSAAAVVASWWWLGIDKDGTVNDMLAGAHGSMWFVETSGKELLILGNFFVLLPAILCSHWAVFKWLKMQDADNRNFKWSWPLAVTVSFAFAVLLAAVLAKFEIVMLFIFIFPLIGAYSVAWFHSTKEESAWAIAGKTLTKGYGKLLVLLFFYSFGILLMGVLTQMLFGQLVNTFISTFLLGQEYSVVGGYIIPGFVGSLLLFTFTTLLFIAYHLSYFSLAEVYSARLLKQRIEDGFPIEDMGRSVKKSILTKGVFAS